MDKTGIAAYSKNFKAKVALEAIGNNNAEVLAEKYSLPVPTITKWVNEIRERAGLLFTDTQTSDQTKVIHNYAALLRTSLEASPNGILVTDLDQNIITYNQKCVDMWNVPEHIVARSNMDEVMQHALRQVKNPEQFKHTLQEMYQYPKRQVSDIIKLQNGRFFKRYSVPYRVNGENIGRVINFVDITDYKKNEAKLKEFGNLLQSINENVNEAILRSTPEKGLVYVNDAFVHMFGYGSKQEVLETDPDEFYAEEEVRNKLISKLVDSGGFKNEEVLFKRKDGSTFWGLENSTLVENNGDTYIDGVVTNIDNWKEAEGALRKSEEKYRSILRNVEEGYFETNLQGDFTFFNAKLVEIMGYPADEMIGMNNREYMEEGEAEKVFSTFNRVFETGEPEQGFDWQLTRGDGSRSYVEASVTLRKDSEGNPLGFSGMIRDISDRKRKEKQIRDSLKEKEVLLGEIHHRVKNNLAVISGLLYLQADRTDDESAFRALRQSQNRINSMALIHELLYNNRTFASLNPQEYIEQLISHIASNLEAGEADITTKIKADDFDLEMSTAIPCALIINELITNAYKYAFEEQKKGLVKIIFTKKDNGQHHIEVADNGQGLPEGFDIQDHNQHSLGLSLVKTLTKQLRGKLKALNGDGARFIITFNG